MSMSTEPKTMTEVEILSAMKANEKVLNDIGKRQQELAKELDERVKSHDVKKTLPTLKRK